MGHVKAEIPRSELVNDIESIIHHPTALKELMEDARASLARTGSLPHDEIWNYLTWRRDLDPSRFDYYHPEFVGVFRREQHLLAHETLPRTDPPTAPLSIETIAPSIVTPMVIPATTATAISPSSSGTSSGPGGNVSPDYRPGHGAVPEPSSAILLAGAMVVGVVWVLARKWRNQTRQTACA